MSRPLRADAARNRLKVLEAAEAVFGEQGIGASTEEIAQRAGVGVGTVFRHFPTKELLLTGVYVSRLERLAGEAEALAADPVSGAGASGGGASGGGSGPSAFVGFFARMVEQSSSKNAVVDALTSAGVDVAASRARSGGQFRRALGLLLDRAQQAGDIRRDLDVDAVIALLAAASRAYEQPAPAGPRALAVILDGMKPRPTT